MSRRPARDAVIVGGGVVGAACALALADAGLNVALVEGREPARWQADRPDLRVYAFAADNAALLDGLGVWAAVRATRAQPYRRMRVWDAGGGGELGFDADTLGRDQLGWIVEHDLLVDRLWAAVHAAGIALHCPARVVELEQDAAGVRLRLDDGSRLEAAIAIAADGAASTLRELSGVPVARHAYAQRGVVAFVDTEHPHQATAWQRFLTTGPLALLPFADGRSSIVWTLPDADAERVLALDDAAFSRELTLAFAARLGHMRVVSARAAFPLQRQLVQQYVSGRVLAVGDAAHVVHPLAGQGVNLGLRDVAALRDTVRQALAKRAEWAAPHRLQRWARVRRSENTLAAYGFDTINRVFSNDDLHLTLLRGSVLGLAGRLPPLVDVLWRRASGAG
ncbi:MULTISPECIES: UbiH/UbiF family hydroxylase [Xanthomonas]|uniref:2-octaprenyl-3-methyl-6-methoxy-1,4-benzoquinol hydroxylase n=1 Tax=Xanthomonas cucurbitae TaxID=56453 RepID=A0A2S7DUU1_9XANT|nr:UbiH/UbiF family hydroxylase [Xanthomonas cucurbitae]PPU77499.1 2-octaprenyl-3-methyl-6-methoxy-1,4-benzoquinol hydroxylase [Xanthomonas cucurbitae]QHG86167.1 UbiH/UbiF family hydroxylase [Xanthomonas cucurbitae]WDM68413.1 UbiH/UbiF family hydroxylase [Xanthomonas cucurbitae]WDM72286.1 UbiH/UbiF family hydroxylase [Xanthomonas cucurbitae]WDM76081.1 UbiH/UbiF family hydroxylase [Xanthomonas cucurbitae]